jgi:hypothetical protein
MVQRSQEEYCGSIIAEVRRVYGGLITYHTAKIRKHVSWWDAWSYFNERYIHQRLAAPA